MASWDEEFEVVETLLGSGDLCFEHSLGIGSTCHGLEFKGWGGWTGER